MKSILSLILWFCGLTPLHAQAPAPQPKAPAAAASGVSTVLAQAKTATMAKQYAGGLVLLQQAQAQFTRPADQKRLRIAIADLQFTWAESLSDARPAEALPHYKAALAIDRPLRPAQAANDLRRCGLACLSLRRYPQALSLFQKALMVSRKVADREGEAKTLNNIGLVYDDLSQYAEALASFQQALPIQRQVGDKAGEARTLNNIGTVYDDLGQYTQALDCLQRALSLKRQISDKAGEAATLNNIGLVYDNLSQYAQALKFYQQSLPIRKQVGDQVGEATTLNNIGNVYTHLSQYAQALNFYQQALPIQKQVRDKTGEAGTLLDIGLVYAHLSQYAQALGYFQQALALQKQVGDRSGEIATLNNIGLVYDNLSQYLKALDFYQQTLTIERRIGDKAGEAGTLNNIGLAYDHLSQYPRALEFYQQALGIERRIGDKAGEATTLVNIGTVYDALNQYAQALDYFQQTLPTLKQIGDKDDEAGTLANMMIGWRQLQSPRLAIWYGKQAVNAYQSIRANITTLDQEAQKSYLTANADTYRTLADLLIGQGRLPEAEQVLAMLKQQELTDFVIRDARLAPSALLVSFDTDEQTVAARYQALADPVTRLGQQIEALRAKKGRTNAENQQLVALQDQLDPAAKTFQAFLATDLPHELTQAKADPDRPAAQQTLGPLQKQLAQMGPGTVALITLVETDKLRIIVVTSTTQKAEETPLNADDLRHLVLQWRDALQNPHVDPRPLGQKLSQILFGPIEKDLIGAKATTLLWSLDDVLRYIPVAALYDGQRYLVEKYRTSVFTGASLAGFGQPAADWQAGDNVLLALGVTQAHTVTDPASGKAVDFPALPGVASEIKQITRTNANPGGVLPGKPLEDALFTQQSLRTGLAAGYPVVHIASHFELGADYRSSFLLLGDGTPLTLDALFGQGGQVFQGVDLLTLSACQTGEGGGDGHEFESLAALAQAQGASSILASLWPVSDETTPLVMREFYRQKANLPGMTKAEALRQAQLSLLHGTVTTTAGEDHRAGRAVEDEEDNISALPAFKTDAAHPYAHPYYWAPFVLIGNWK